MQPLLSPENTFDITMHLLIRIGLLALAEGVFAVPSFAQPAECQAGVTAFLAKNYDAAVPPLTQCLSLPIPPGPRSLIFQVRAEVFGAQDQWDMAIADQQAAIAAAPPKDAWPYVMLGAYFRKAQRLDDSIAALQTAMTFDEDGPGSGPGMAVHYHMAQTLHQARRYREAIEVLTKGIPKQPDYAYAFYQRALSYEALGDRDQAKRDLFRASELARKDGVPPDIAGKFAEYGLPVKVYQR